MVNAAFVREVAPRDTLPVQLWVDWAGHRGRPAPANMDRPGSAYDYRPAGGLWTSTWDPATGSCPYLDELHTVAGPSVRSVRRPAWLLTPKPCRVWHIEDHMGTLDLFVLADGQMPAWERVAGLIDAVHMTEQGARSFLRLPRHDAHPVVRELRYRAAAAFMDPPAGPLNWWYAESTWWPRWNFAKVEQIDDLDVPDVPAFSERG